MINDPAQVDSSVEDSQDSTAASAQKIAPLDPVKVSPQNRPSRESMEVYGFQGPLPPPSILKAYDLVEPGLANRIVSLAEKQAHHRMNLEKTVITGDDKRAWAGLVAGFVLACLGFVGSYDLIRNGKEVSGSILGGGVLVSLVGVFVYGTNKRSEERIEKRRDLLGKDSQVRSED
ncbi:DUF2335 domain-containing protein [Alkalinema sp. FACHB-956]|uniref:DUF2335 domain-containing protein n=1 Tax=Alkalinema sp. FACHB-956 TaxID=2692768 RepID=UPI00168789F1|nr:DUF2335 domain-containing protein [Alkalinema sp. FACHB-956]MBD2326284.1 DUF2335 domain-containing protein [Alkalinema sp. FACHB-956]